MRLISAALMLLAAMTGTAAALAQTERIALPVGTRSGTVTLQADLYRPSTAAPAPAVVLMHGCSGMGVNHRHWAGVLNAWGYVALAVDSFGGRDVKEVCTGKQNVASRERAFDVAAAADWLKRQTYVRADRIGLVGYSHGGATALFASLQIPDDRGGPLPVPGFAAAVAFYPDCSLRGTSPARAVALRPVLILIGDKDDWTPSSRCHELTRAVSGQPVTLQTYPEAVHGFDSPGSRLRYRDDVRNRNKPGGCCGAWVGFHEASYRDASMRVQAFFVQWLGK
jgi:dienelactone hydrolase